MLSKFRIGFFLALGVGLAIASARACSIPPEGEVFVKQFAPTADDIFLGKIVSVQRVEMDPEHPLWFTVDVDIHYRGRQFRRKVVRGGMSDQFDPTQRYFFAALRNEEGLYLGPCNYHAEFPKIIDATDLKSLGKGVPVPRYWPVERPPSLPSLQWVMPILKIGVIALWVCLSYFLIQWLLSKSENSTRRVEGDGE